MENIKISPTNHIIAPFEGMILSSQLTDKGGRRVNIKKLISKYKREGVVKGIVFDGDWETRPLEFVNVLEELKNSGLGVVINTTLNMDDFKLNLGIASYNKTKNINMNKKDVSNNDIPMLVFIGGILIDFYLSYTEYYIRYMENGEYKLCKIDLPKEEENER